jgi:putative transcriptional regulator
MAKKTNGIGEALIGAMHEAIAIEKGKMKPTRSHVVRVSAREATVSAPPRYNATRIRKIRGSMGLSQALFAGTLTVSPETVRAWEQGRREPEGATLRLLELAAEKPEVLLEAVATKV